jgi:hypothetical protein
MALGRTEQADSGPDPRLARVYAAGATEEPPPALDDAIRAAARRAVGAGPAMAGAAPRARRNWYVPLSVAAVLVLSVSLVTLVKQEKADDLAEPPRVSAPAPAPAPVAAPVPKVEAPVVAASDARLEQAPASGAAAARREERAKASAPVAENQARSRDDQLAAPAAMAKATEAQRAPGAEGARRQPEARPPDAGGTISAPPAAVADVAPAPASPAVPPPAPFPAAKPVLSEPPAAPEARVAEAASARQADRSATRPAIGTRGLGAESAPDSRLGSSDRRDAEPPAGAPEKLTTRSGRAAPQAAAAKPAWLIELDAQPPARWLERLAEFRRDGRQVEAEQLLTEFRRRFPDHPASR